MAEYLRYAIYDAPRGGAFADRVASWLGWDAETGQPVPFASPADLPVDQCSVIQAPRKYGFHGTLKAPFRLAQGMTRQQLSDRLAQVSKTLPEVTTPGLEIKNLGGFLALLPTGGHDGISQLAGQVVRLFDDFRAPLTSAEVARRNPDKLTPRQNRLLQEWGYPYVMEEFQFHLTLTDKLAATKAEAVADALADWLAPVLPRPFKISDLCLFGEAADGSFHLLERHPLGVS